MWRRTARESKTVRFSFKVPQVPAYTKWVNTASTHYDNNPDNPNDPEEPKPEKPSNEVEVDTDVTGLLVSKTAVVPEGVADDGSAAFAFDVTVVAPDGKPVAGSYFMARATEKDEAGAWVFGEPEPVQFADGRPVLADSAPLTLRNLEAVRFIGLPEKATYQVVETPADGWTQTKAENAEGSLTTGATVGWRPPLPIRGLRPGPSGHRRQQGHDRPAVCRGRLHVCARAGQRPDPKGRGGGRRGAARVPGDHQRRPGPVRGRLGCAVGPVGLW